MINLQFLQLLDTNQLQYQLQLNPGCFIPQECSPVAITNKILILIMQFNLLATTKLLPKAKTIGSLETRGDLAGEKKDISDWLWKIQSNVELIRHL